MSANDNPMNWVDASKTKPKNSRPVRVKNSHDGWVGIGMWIADRQAWKLDFKQGDGERITRWTTIKYTKAKETISDHQ